MGMTLLSVGTTVDFYFNIWTWRYLLALAKQYGWEPLGTEGPREEFNGEYLSDDGWDGNYLSNAFQFVRSEDAKAMAEALEIALLDVCDSRKPEKHEINDMISNDPIIKGMREFFRGKESDLEERFNQMVLTSPLAYFRDGGKETLIGFINFCKKGGFVIC